MAPTPTDSDHGPSTPAATGPAATIPSGAPAHTGRAASDRAGQDRTARDRTAPDHVATIQAEWRRERPDLDVSPQAVIGRLHRLSGRLTEELCLVYGRYGLGEGEFDVLAALRRAGAPFERAPGELAARTMVTTGAMTKRIDRLERAGLVTRRRSEADGRGRVVALTEAGRRLFDEAFTAHMRNEHRLLSVLTPEEAAALETLLTAWQRRLDHPEPPPAGHPEP